MKKLFLIVLLSVPCRLAATVTKTYRWQAPGIKLSVSRNYGTPLGEAVRAKEERVMAYRLFNLMRSSGKKLEYEIYWPGYKPRQKDILREIDIKKAAADMGISVEKEENFAARIGAKKMWHLNWTGDILSLVSGNIVAYRSTAPYTFCGRSEYNILINQAGQLLYLDEVEWLPVPALKDYSAGKIGWLAPRKIVVFAQHSNSGRKFLAIASVRKDKAKFIPAPKGEFRDVIISEDSDQVYAVSFYRGQYKIEVYIRDEVKWEERETLIKEPLLLTVSGGRVIWYNRESGTVNISGEEEIRGVEISEVITYPEGDYIVDYEDGPVGEAETKKTALLFYNSDAAEKLKDYGITGINVYGIDKDIWLMPEKYSKNFEKLPEQPGNISLNIDDQIVYYDIPGQDGLREIKNFKLGFSKMPVILIAAALFIIIIIVVVLKYKE